jgi:hypothetical protein
VVLTKLINVVNRIHTYEEELQYFLCDVGLIKDVLGRETINNEKGL